jgi:4-hydroxythreonine-4-phosphate dehydrogenase
MGDPAGIGPELCVKAASNPAFLRAAEPVVYGCPGIILHAAELFTPGAKITVRETGSLNFGELTPGRESAVCGKAAVAAVEAAAKDALSGEVDAVVTAPVNKASVNMSGLHFTGHTEFIAEICGTKSFAMMQSSGSLRVAFVTTHIALREVPAQATAERIIEAGRLLWDAVKSEGVSAPKLAAAAINPHAGELGYMGREDEDTVKPALAKLREAGVNIDGPFPPDTLFIKKIRDRYDGLLSMYHDQGHIPFKMLAFDKGVNSTLGLPVIRTSPDHGTAFEIAWKGSADTGSMFAAVKLAIIRAKTKYSSP